MIKLLQGDCLELMKNIPDKSIDMILCDLPYGTSACKWDSIIPFDKLWNQYNRIIKDDGAIVLFGNQPFTSKLIISNLNMYKYNWVWIKDNATNFLNKKYQAGKITEDICVFGKMATSYSKKGNMKYFPQFTEGKPYKTTNNVERRTNAVIRSTITNVITDNKGTRLPNNVLYFNRDKDKVHPTQKPVALLEYLIKTYTNENEIVLDNCMGSGSTGIACLNTNRTFIGMELDENYFNIAKERIEKREKELLNSGS
jgi:site-specific DNA-methyltransferase (adenine-specific)